MSKEMIFSLLEKHNSPAKGRVIYLTQHGSRAYGTNIEGSDYDYKGICIPSKQYYVGFGKNFEQQEFSDPDTVIYEIRKFLSLLYNNNPNVIETLFTADEDRVFVSFIGEQLLEQRDMFLSKRIRWSFGGYAFSQLKKMSLHRDYFLNPPKSPPTREEMGLKEKPSINKGDLEAAFAMIQKDLDRVNFDFIENLSEPDKIGLRHIMGELLSEWKITSEDRWMSATRKIGFDDNMILILQKEKEYASKKRSWDNFLSWKKTRNPERYADEAKIGFDCKNAYHLIRLLRCCLEVLATGKMNVKRPDYEELLEIRRGEWSYDKIIEETNNLNGKIDEAFKTSSLPSTPNFEKINHLCQSLIEKSF